MSKENKPSDEFEAIMNNIARNKQAKAEKPQVFVSYSSEAPEVLEQVLQAGDLFGRTEIRNELLKTQEPNSSFTGRVTNFDKWTDEKTGRKIIDILYKPITLNLPFSVGVQLKDGEPDYEKFKDLPDDFRGQVVIETDKNGLIASVSLAE